MDRKILVWFAFFFLFLFGIQAVRGGVMEKTLQDFKLLLYGIVAGVAALLLAVYGLKIKMASSPGERKEAKRGLIYVTLGLILVIIASGLVELLYQVPPKPPAPVIINAQTHALTNPSASWDNQTRLGFFFKNNLTENLTQVEVEVSSLQYSWCDEDLSNYVFPKVGIIYAGNAEHYSYSNFCEISTQFLVEVRCDQNWWNFCLNCPGPGGDCNASIGNC